MRKRRREDGMEWKKEEEEKEQEEEEGKGREEEKIGEYSIRYNIIMYV